MGKTIFFLGSLGSNSHLAARIFQNPGDSLKGRSTFEEIFASVKKTAGAEGIIPLENSTTGSIGRSFDILLEEKLSITGEIILKINHCLIVNGQYKGLSSLKYCLSHPEVFKQCRKFLSAQKHIEPVSQSDTTSACLTLKSAGAEYCAIAGPLAAEINNLKTVREHLEDYSQNLTRFIAVSTKPRGTGNKASLIFTLAHRPGSLVEVLKPIAEEGLNLTKIESRPMVRKPWEYLFFTDLENISGTKIRRVLKKMALHTLQLKILGIYEKGGIYND